MAEQLGKIFPAFDIAAFSNDLTNGKGGEVFRSDMKETAAAGVTRFTTMIIRQQGMHSLMISGYRPFHELWRIICAHFNVSFAKEENVE